MHVGGGVRGVWSMSASPVLKHAMPAALHLPYRAHVTPNVVTAVSGDYLVTWRVGGIAFECADDQHINGAHERLNVWLRNQGSPEVSLWSHVVRRRETVLASMPQGHGFAATLAERYLTKLVNETLWVNELYLTLVYRPANSRVANVALRWLSTRDDDTWREERLAALSAIEKLAVQVEGALERYELDRLGCYLKEGRQYSSLLEFLGLLVNAEAQPMPLPRAPLSDALATTRLLVGQETLEYRSPSSTRFGAMLAIKEYPTPTSPGLLNRLLSAPFAFVLTQSFAFLSKSTAVGLLNRQYHRLRNAADVAVSQASALKAALDQLGSNEFVMGNHHFSLQVLSAPVASSEMDRRPVLTALEASIASARSILGDAGMVVAREDLALEAAFWAQLPGNFSSRPRVAPITSRNFAGLSPFHQYPKGRAHGNHWGDALTVFKTSAASPYYFSLHASDPKDPTGGNRRDTGHTFICGPTGSGKTVMVGFCLSLYQYLGVTQVVFDKDHGLEILVRALGGQYLSLKRGQQTGCNPLQLPTTPSNRVFLARWLRSLIHRVTRPLTARDESELDDALAGTLLLPMADRRLSRLLEFLDPTVPDGLYARLSRWCISVGGELGTVFDASTDQIAPLLTATTLLGFDMTDVLDDPVIRGPLVDYLFHLLETLLDGRRFVAWLDEFAKLIGDGGFVSLANDGTKTWRKRNGVIAFATQSPHDVLDSPLARTLIEQTPTKIFFPNPDAHRDDYVNGFGLTEREYELISRELTAGSRRFLIKQGHDSVVAELDLKGFDAELKVISGRSSSVALLERVMAIHGTDPSAWLPHFTSQPTTTH